LLATPVGGVCGAITLAPSLPRTRAIRIRIPSMESHRVQNGIPMVLPFGAFSSAMIVQSRRNRSPSFSRSISLSFQAPSSRASTSAILAIGDCTHELAILALYVAAPRFLSISWIAFNASQPFVFEARATAKSITFDISKKTESCPTLIVTLDAASNISQFHYAIQTLW
jgi:hypothetical protein